MAINRTTIVGNLTRDPELRQLQSGSNVVSLRVAVNDRRKNQYGQWEDAPNFFNVTAFDGLANNVAQYTRKGSQVAIDGRLRWREWQDQQGNKRESIEIVASDIQFIGPRADQQQQPQGYGEGYRGQQPAQQQPPQGAGWPPQQQAPPAQPPQQRAPQGPPPPAQQPPAPPQQQAFVPDDDIPF